MNHPLLVCGHGRCGSSLVMNMLDAGGYPVHGSFPDYEPEDVGMFRDTTSLLAGLNGRAAKILEPHQSQWPISFSANVIWLHRDKKEQAKSQLKFLRFMNPSFHFRSGAWKNVAESFRADTERCLEIFASRRCRILELDFEDILRDPGLSVRTIDRVFGLNLNVERSASVVIRRSPKCAKDCSIEENAMSSRARQSANAEKVQPVSTAEESANTKAV